MSGRRWEGVRRASSGLSAGVGSQEESKALLGAFLRDRICFEVFTKQNPKSLFIFSLYPVGIDFPYMKKSKKKEEI